MNLLSLFSSMIASAFLIGGLYCLTRDRKSVLNVFSFLVLLSLGWWNFCYAFFFSAETAEQASLWHHLAAIGWTGFIAETTYYFIVLTGFHDKMKKTWVQLCFYALPFALLLHNLFGKTTSLAEGFVKSSVGNQWSYTNSLGNGWLWLFLACIVLYFGFSFYLLLRWSSKVKHRLKKRMAIGFVVLDALTILLGFASDVLFPLTSAPLIPAVANLCAALFGVGYFLIIIRYDLFNLHHVVADRDIIERSTDAVLVIDEDGEILYCNPSCAKLLGTNTSELMGGKFPDYIGAEQYRAKLTDKLSNGDSLNDVELSLDGIRTGEKRLLMSASVIRDKQKEFLGIVVSLRDITQLSNLKEQYMLQSDRYERLAYIDTLTGLPNRRKTFEVLGNRASDYEENKNDFFLLYMDLDDFKAVNDEYGHAVGDQFLIEVASRLNRYVSGDINFLGRLCGDELLMIGGSDTSEATIISCIKKITEAFREEFCADTYKISGGISIGYARYSDFRNVDAMIHHADEHMYEAKQKTHTRTRKSPR